MGMYNAGPAQIRVGKASVAPREDKARTEVAVSYAMLSRLAMTPPGPAGTSRPGMSVPVPAPAPRSVRQRAASVPEGTFDEETKASARRDMFNRIATNYDLLNDALSLG